MFKRLLLLTIFLYSIAGVGSDAEELWAGAAKVDVTDPDQPANPALYARALALSEGEDGPGVILISIDVVAIGGIGRIKDTFLPEVRAELQEKLGIAPGSVVINASHCHGVICGDAKERTIRAAEEAWKKRVPVKAGAGSGEESRIMVNRRVILKDGKEADIRHAYSMPPDEEVASVGPVDPEIGALRLDRVSDGKPLALVFHFSMHPIQGVPEGRNTADISGFAAQVIEENLGDETVALFVQGCGGDINPINYKTVDQPRDAEPLGNLLGLSTLKAVRKIETREAAPLFFTNETIEVPRADLSGRIAEMGTEIDALLDSLKGTTLDLKAFLPLYLKYLAGGETPAYYAHGYLQEDQQGEKKWEHLDSENRKNLEAYIRNIRTMEELARKQINLALLEKHQEWNAAAGMKPLAVEVTGLRVGDFRLVTFPAEVTVQIGLNIKKASPHKLTFVSGYTNGYHFYAPTAKQLLNRGGAQEDSDCLLAPEWQALFEEKALELLKKL